MKDIVDITVTQVRLYPTDRLPFAQLRLPANMKTLKETFHFADMQVDPLGLQITFSNGSLEHRGKLIHALNLTIEQRKVLIQVRGRSWMADALDSAFSKVLQSFDGRSKASKLEPLLKAEETTCVVTLDIDFDDLIAPPLLRFIQGEAKAKLRTNYGIPKSVGFRTLSFEVKYEPAIPHLEEHGISLSNKLITIEPRMGTPLQERRFYTSSPTDSDTHLALLETLEKEVAKAHGRKNK